MTLAEVSKRFVEDNRLEDLSWGLSRDQGTENRSHWRQIDSSSFQFIGAGRCGDQAVKRLGAPLFAASHKSNLPRPP